MFSFLKRQKAQEEKILALEQRITALEALEARLNKVEGQLESLLDQVDEKIKTQQRRVDEGKLTQAMVNAFEDDDDSYSNLKIIKESSIIDEDQPENDAATSVQDSP